MGVSSCAATKRLLLQLPAPGIGTVVVLLAGWLLLQGRSQAFPLSARPCLSPPTAGCSDEFPLLGVERLCVHRRRVSWKICAKDGNSIEDPGWTRSAKRKEESGSPSTSSTKGLKGASSSTRTKGKTTKYAKKKSTSKKKKSKKAAQGPTHWSLPSDPFLLISEDRTSQELLLETKHLSEAESEFETPTTTNTENEAAANGDTDESYSTVKRMRFTVRGNPMPLRRHRTSRGFVYNPSAKAQESFRLVVQELLTSHTKNQTQAWPSSTTPFGSDQALAMSIVFCTKRPNGDFVGGRPGLGRLRPTTGAKRVAPSRLWPPTRVDTDNLAKFVLDSLNGLVYDDDRQVVSLHATKLRDDDDECKGSTEVDVRVIKESDIGRLLNRTFDLF